MNPYINMNVDLHPSASFGQPSLRQQLSRWLSSRRELLLAVLVGQLLSFLLCLTGTTSEVLATRGISVPTSQSFLNYCLLAVTCGLAHLASNKWCWRLTNSWRIYMLLGLLDVEANFLLVRAYAYTSITSVTLLDCFTLPAVMVLSWAAFRSRYKYGHVAGALLCIGGLTVLVLTDGSSVTGGPNPLLGDLLVICGAILYAVCNVAQERLLVEASRWELLACVGIVGAVISGIQAAVLEHQAWVEADWDAGAVGALFGFALSLYSFYVLLPSVLVWSSSTVLNLSLLTSDLWAAGSRSLFFGGFGGTAHFFAIALAAEVVGIIVYTASGDTHKLGGSHAAGTAATAGAAPPADIESETDPLIASRPFDEPTYPADRAHGRDSSRSQQDEEEGVRTGLLAGAASSQRLSSASGESSREALGAVGQNSAGSSPDADGSLVGGSGGVDGSEMHSLGLGPRSHEQRQPTQPQARPQP